MRSSKTKHLYTYILYSQLSSFDPRSAAVNSHLIDVDGSSRWKFNVNLITNFTADRLHVSIHVTEIFGYSRTESAFIAIKKKFGPISPPIGLGRGGPCKVNFTYFGQCVKFCRCTSYRVMPFPKIL